MSIHHSTSDQRSDRKKVVTITSGGHVLLKARRKSLPWLLVCLLFLLSLPAEAQDNDQYVSHFVNGQSLSSNQAEAAVPSKLESTLSIDAEEVVRAELLRHISEQSDLGLIYGSHKVLTETTIPLRLEQVTALDATNAVLKGTGLGLTFSESGPPIVVSQHEISMSTSTAPSAKIEPRSAKTSTSSRLEGNLGRVTALDLRRGTVSDFEHYQEIVTGQVVSSEGESLPGVTVIVEGTQIGTTTDVEGNYEIEIPADITDPVLVFSMVGMQTEQVPVEGRSTIDVVLTEDILALEDIVVTGYGGVQQRREVTGSISSVDAEAMATITEPSLENALQGRASGVHMTQAGGSPVERSRILIRGVTSVSSGTEPLFVIDGMPVSGTHTDAGGMDMNVNPMSMINPSDIESIEVLKDAAATAIYGSRGSNGVVLITTKSGTPAGRLEVNYRTGVSAPVNTYSFVDTPTWLNIVDSARENNPTVSGMFDPLTDYSFAGDDRLTRSEIENIQTDWFDLITRNGGFQDVNLSVSGGDERGSTYFLSANYRGDSGFLIGNDTDRFAVRSNVEIHPSEGLTMGLRSTASLLHVDEVRVQGGAPGGNDQIADGNWVAAVNNVPWLPVFRDDGEFFDILSGNNLAATLNEDWYTSWSRHLRGLGQLYAEYQLPFLEGMSLRSEVSADYRSNSSIRSSRPELRPLRSPYGRISEGTNWDLNFNVFGTYRADVLQNHHVVVTVGGEAYTQNNESRFTEALNRTATDEMLGSPSGADIARFSHGRGEETRFLGVFSRINYRYADRYLAEFSVRRDGASVFGRQQLFGTFPAASVGWIVSEEAFMDNVDLISFLKLRASYGLTGNSNIPSGVTTDGFAGWKQYGAVPQGFFQTGTGSQEIGWETTESLDLGFEYGLFDDRISGTVTYYREDITDMLLNSPIAASSGTSSKSIWANIGDIRNSGFEFDIRSVILDARDFLWRSEFNLTFSSNEVLQLTPILAETNAGIIEGRTNTRIGHRLGAYFVAMSAGIDPDTGYEMIYAVDNEPFITNGDGERVHNPNYLRVDRNTLLPATEGNVAENRALLTDKSGMPSYFGGITNNISYRGISLGVTFNFQGGHYLYDTVYQNHTNVGGGSSPLHTDYIGSFWTPDNTNAEFPRPSWNNQHVVDGEPRTFSTNTSRYLFRGDFIRLRNVRIAYRIPETLVQRLGINGLELSASASNLWLYAPDFPGLDPEVSSFGDPQSRNLNPGTVGATMLPPMRQFNVGISMQL